MKDSQVVEEDSAAISVANQGDSNEKNNVSNDEKTPKRRGRPRRSEIPSPIITPTSISIPVVSDKEIRLNRRRALKDIFDESVELVIQNESKDKTEPKVRKRKSCAGRKKATCQDEEDDEYIPRKKSENSDNALEKLASGKTSICAKCKEEVPPTQWSKHNSTKHNGMAWRDGEKEPDFSDENVLRRHLVKIHRSKRKLICEICGAVKKSVAGFMSHLTFCGKNEEEAQALMWICPLCRGCYKPSSVEFHERWHREQEELKSQKQQNEQDGIEPEDSENHGKRKAAEQAVSKISEFTEIIKNIDEKPPTMKRIKLTAELKEIIDVPRSSQFVPGVFKGFWKRAIAAGKLAECRQPGCNFSSNTMIEICAHHSQCNFEPRKSLICKICLFSTEDQTEIISHVHETHAEQLKKDSDFHATDEESNESDEENTKTESRERKKTSRAEKTPSTTLRAKFLENAHHHQDMRTYATFLPAIHWTMEFELENYSFELFKDLQPNNNELPSNNLIQTYLPQQRISMSMRERVYTNKRKKIQENENTWINLKLFEGKLVNDLPVIFTGGPVWAMAWLPIPSILYDQKPNQYLAVSTHPTMKSSYEPPKSYKFKNCIQIWNFGNLGHGLTFIPEVPKCSYIIAHEYGTVWSMEWCPSGVYDNNLQKKNIVRRMGLLAAGGSDGCVHIFSLPFPDSLNLTNDPPVLKTEPVVTLHVNDTLERISGVKWQCMKVNWSKTNGHDTLVAGFSNGYVALWDLKTISSKLSSRRGPTIHLNAYKHFYAHAHAVMYAEIIPIDENRFLITAGMDRYSKIWDLETLLPVQVLKKGVAVNGTWITHWPSLFIACDDALGMSHTQTHINGVREPPNRAFPLLPTNSTCFGIASSDWANGICHGTLAGEVAAIFPSQMLYIKDLDELPRKRWLLSSVEAVNLKDEEGKSNTDYKYSPETYEDCHEKFGIIFTNDLGNLRSNETMKNRKSSMQTDSMKMVPVEQYPFVSVNRIAWNHNVWSHLWLAAGYENGLVRIMHLKAFTFTSTIEKSLLPEHAKKMLNRFGKNRVT